MEESLTPKGLLRSSLLALLPSGPLPNGPLSAPPAEAEARRRGCVVRIVEKLAKLCRLPRVFKLAKGSRKSAATVAVTEHVAVAESVAVTDPLSVSD